MRRKITPTITDKIAGWLNPKWGLQRLKYRAALTQGYDAVRKTRLDRDRNTAGGTGDDHLDHETLWDLREISRDLYRNNGLFRGLIKTSARKIIGPRGYQLIADPKVKAYWSEWTKKDHCDLRGKQNFWAMMRLALRTRFVDGDFFFWKSQIGRTGKGSLAPLEGDRIFSPTGSPQNVINGIRLKRTGEPAGYWVADQIPRRDYIDAVRYGYAAEDRGRWYRADEILHFADWERTSSTRGEPIAAPIRRELDDLDSLLSSTRVAARVDALRPFAVIKEDAEYWADLAADEDRIEDIEPGEVIYLNPGEDIKSVASEHPSPEFREFVRVLARLVGVPFGLPLELILLDFSEGNFSAARLALQQAQDAFEEHQQNLIDTVLDPTFEFVIQLAIENGEFGDVSEEERKNLLKHQWIPTGFPYVEPVKEVDADTRAVALRITSRRRIAARRGDDYDEIQKELAEEEAAGAKPPAIKEGNNTVPDDGIGEDPPEEPEDMDSDTERDIDASR